MRTSPCLPTCVWPLIASLTCPLSGADVLKSNTGTSLTDPANWDGSALPGSLDIATWGNAIGGKSLGGALTWASNTSPSYQGIKVLDATTNIAITSAGGASTLTLGSGGIDMSAAAVNLSIHNTTTAGTSLGIAIGANQSWNVGAGRTLAVGNSGTTITLSNKLTKSGSGTFTLGGTGATTLTGAGEIEIDGGIFANNLQTGSSATGRSGATTLTSGTLSIATSINMFGTGDINLNGGTIGSFSTTGRDIGTANAVKIGGNIQIGGSVSGVLGSGYVRFGGATDLGGAVRTINSQATGVFSGNGAGAIFNGIVSNGGITKEGSGYLTLGNNSNSFSGAVTINGGNIAFSSKALANASSVTLANSGVWLVIGENGAGITHDIKNLSGVSGSIIRSDFGISGTSTSRILKIDQSAAGEFAGSFIEGSGGRTIALIKTGTAALTLSGTGGYSAGTTLSQGTIIATSANALGSGGTVTINDTNTGTNNTALRLGSVTMGRAITVANEGTGTVTLGANGAVALPEFSGAITLNKAVTLDGGTNTDRLTFTGGIGGTGNVTIAGTGRVVFNTTANTYNGSTTISAGSTLQLGTGGSIATQLIANSSVVNTGAGSFLKLAKGNNNETIGGLTGTGKVRGHEGVAGVASVLTINTTGTHSFGGVLENGGASGSTLSLVKDGSGSQTLSGTNTYTGTTTVSAGTLFVTGALGNTAVSVSNGATIGGTGSIDGTLALGGASFLEVVDFDNPLSVAGAITFGSGFGIANLTGIDWDALSLNTSYTVLSTTQTFGTGDIANFGAANATAVGTGRFAYFDNGSLAVVVIPEPAATLLGGIGLLFLLRRRR